MTIKVVKLNFKHSLPCRICAKPAEFREDYVEGGSFCFCRVHLVKKASFRPEERVFILPPELC